MGQRKRRHWSNQVWDNVDVSMGCNDCCKELDCPCTPSHVATVPSPTTMPETRTAVPTTTTTNRRTKKKRHPLNRCGCGNHPTRVGNPRGCPREGTCAKASPRFFGGESKALRCAVSPNETVAGSHPFCRFRTFLHLSLVFAAHAETHTHTHTALWRNVPMNMAFWNV